MTVHYIRQIAKEFKERYKDTKINKILTIEASGIGIALATAFELGDVPVVFAKKGTAKTTKYPIYIQQKFILLQKELITMQLLVKSI